jgi:hypothetical protein
MPVEARQDRAVVQSVVHRPAQAALPSELEAAAGVDEPVAELPDESVEELPEESVDDAAAVDDFDSDRLSVR